MNIKYEKATKFEKISNLSCFYSVASKEVGDFFDFLWPFQKSSTLPEIVGRGRVNGSRFIRQYFFCIISG